MQRIDLFPNGVCALRITAYVDSLGKIDRIEMDGPCDGNVRAINALVRGKHAMEVSGLLRGIRCDGHGSSCAALLSDLLRSYCVSELGYTGFNADVCVDTSESDD